MQVSATSKHGFPPLIASLEVALEVSLEVGPLLGYANSATMRVSTTSKHGFSPLIASLEVALEVALEVGSLLRNANPVTMRGRTTSKLRKSLSLEVRRKGGNSRKTRARSLKTQGKANFVHFRQDTVSRRVVAGI